MTSLQSKMEDLESEGMMEEDDVEAGGDLRRQTLASPAVSAVVTMTLRWGQYIWPCSFVSSVVCL